MKKKLMSSFLLIFLCVNLFVVLQFSSIPLANASNGLATPVRVQGPCSSSTTSANFFVNLTSTPTQGNALIMALGSYGYHGASAEASIQAMSESGVVWSSCTNSSDVHTISKNYYWLYNAIWYGNVTSTSANKTISVTLSTAPDGGATAVVCEYANLNATEFNSTQVNDQTASNYGDSASTNTGTTATTSVSSEEVIGCTLALSAQSSPTNGFSLLSGGSVINSISVAYLEANVTSTGTEGSGTSITSGYWSGCIATFISAQLPQVSQIAPTLNDFYINNTSVGNTTSIIANCSDAYAIQNCTLREDNGSGTWQQMTVNLAGNGSTSVNATFTINPFYKATTVNFTIFLCNTNPAFDNVTTSGYRTFSIYNTTMPYTSLGNAITAVDDAENWTALMTFGSTNYYYNPYYAVILSHASISDLRSMIDNYSNAQNWYAVIQWSAYCNKLNITQYSDVQTDINYALANYPMLVDNSTDSFPYSSAGSALDNCSYTGYMWQLYGYYFAAQSWATSYNSSITTKWNITSAYHFFNDTMYDSFVTYGMLPQYIYVNEPEAGPSLNRYYDEDAETIEDYLIFYTMLNVSDGLTQALYWWSWTNTWHWNSALGIYCYSGETPGNTAECEAGFFLQIIDELDYYSPNLGNWTNVLTDIGSKFLTYQWSSFLWNDSVVIHAVNCYINDTTSAVNPELRLSNTLGAWDSIIAAYVELNSTLQNDAVTMLSGNVSSNTSPAWNLLLNSPIFNASTLGFMSSSTVAGGIADPYSTAEGLILMFMLGITPGTTTIAFPLEEIMYEYLCNIDPVLLAFNMNQTTRQITIPVVMPGTITFDYGQSPITYNFTSSGVYIISFTSSWNMISSVTYQSALPSNLIYFYLPAGPLAVNISPTSATLIVGQSQLFTSSVSGGTSPYVYQWYLNGAAVQNATSGSWTFTPTSAGPYTLYVEVSDSVGAKATSNTATVTVNIARAIPEIIFLEGPYYAECGIEYWIVKFPGQHAIRLVSNY